MKLSEHAEAHAEKRLKELSPYDKGVFALVLIGFQLKMEGNHDEAEMLKAALYAMDVPKDTIHRLADLVKNIRDVTLNEQR